jgi:outer membrane murein-binding lipoprotein Lpp
MRSLFLMAVVAALLAGCGDGAQKATERADKAMTLVAELQLKVSDLETEVADLNEELDNADPDGEDVGDPDAPRYAATSCPASAFSIRASVRSTPKIATKEPKRGPWL